VLFGAVFLLVASWTLLDNEHIRIDIVNAAKRAESRRRRPRFPDAALRHHDHHRRPFFMRSVEVNEQSGNAGGLPQWPAKSLIIVGFVFLLVQGISELIKRIAVMRGLIPDPHASQLHALEAEVVHLVEAIEKR
jgi:TRAP-type mannitol/chloroaromatic compound transport system permease small subunit